MDHPQCEKYRADIKGTANLLRKHRDLVARLRVHMNCGPFSRLFGCEWPCLEEFVFIDTCSLPRSWHEGDHLPDYEPPGLRVLSIGRSQNWPINTAAHITTLELRGPMDLKFETLSGFFRRNLTLQTLELIDLDVLDLFDRHLEEPVELPHLNRLSVVNTACGRLPTVLRLPSLRHLHVLSSGPQDTWSDSPWPKFCGGLRITNLGAKYDPSRREGITVVGFRGLGARSSHFAVFNAPIALGTALLGSLRNSSLTSVTSLSLIRDMPEGGTPPPLITAVCDLLDCLPQVKYMRLRPGELVVEVLRRLSSDPELCRELRGLEVVVTEKTCETVGKFVFRMLKARVCVDGRRKISIFKGQSDGKVGTRVAWRKFWEKVGLEGGIVDE